MGRRRESSFHATGGDQMARTRKVHDGALDWLLEDDECGVRYLALRDIERLHSNNPTLVNARKKAHQTGPISALLACMSEDGYWSKPGPGYNPKYYSTVWSVITLAQL